MKVNLTVHLVTAYEHLFHKKSKLQQTMVSCTGPYTDEAIFKKGLLPLIKGGGPTIYLHLKVLIMKKGVVPQTPLKKNQKKP